VAHNSRVQQPVGCGGPMHPYQYTVFDTFVHCPMKGPIVVFNQNANPQIGRAEFTDFGALKVLNFLLADAILLKYVLLLKEVRFVR
jgi:hypothetical protein